jgi:hypothetical protein
MTDTLVADCIFNDGTIIKQRVDDPPPDTLDVIHIASTHLHGVTILGEPTTVTLQRAAGISSLVYTQVAEAADGAN